jgi:2-keto-3-deoxy-L-rhamnonate aldolase RhmA
MNKYWMVCGAACLWVLSAGASGQHNEKELKEDIERHRAMATAHGKAAQCLEAGKEPKVCMAELQAACKGLAIGKYCGMKHAH